MKRTLALLAIFMVTLGTQAREFIEDSVKVDGYQRTFKLYLPKGIKADAPLLVSCHGYGSEDGAIDDIIYQAADRHGFAVCAPFGLKDPTGRHSWNVGYPMQDGWKMDDIKSVCKTAQYVQKKYHLSSENCFFSGMSNGGEMCYLLAYSDQTTFKAFGSIAGLTMEWIYKSRTPRNGTPFLEIHGTEDTVSNWWGDLKNEGGWNPYMPVPIAVNNLVAHNRCEEEVVDTIVCQDRPSKRPIVRHKFIKGDKGSEVWLYEVIGASHCYFTEDIDTGELLWEFFSKYIK